MIKKMLPIILSSLLTHWAYPIGPKVVQSTAIPYQDFYAEIAFAPNEAHDLTERYSRFLKGTYLHAKGKLEPALKTLQPMLTQNASPYVYEAFMRLLFDRGNFFAIADLATKQQARFDKIFKDNLEMKLLIAQALLHSGSEEKAEQIFTELSEKYPDN